MYVLWLGGPTPADTFPKPRQFTIGDIQYPVSVLQTWSDAQLANIKIYPFDRAVIQNTEKLDTATYALVNDRVVETATGTVDRYTLDQRKKRRRNRLFGQVETRNEQAFAFNAKPFVVPPGLVPMVTAQGDFARRVIGGSGTWPAGFAWLANDNTSMTMTAQQFADFSDAALARAVAIKLNADAHNIAIGTASTVGELPDVTTGWPT